MSNDKRTFTISFWCRGNHHRYIVTTFQSDGECLILSSGTFVLSELSQLMIRSDDTPDNW